MKELSIEQKAKRYDEIREKAQKWYDANTNEGYRGIFEDIFSELKESEDEKIRIELLAWLKSRDGQTLPIDRYNAAVAWLEKQGDKSDIGISSTTKQKLKDNLNKALEKETQASWNEFLDGGEQKPAWSEEDEEMLNSIIEDFGDGKTSNMLQEYWLKSLKDKYTWKSSDLPRWKKSTLPDDDTTGFNGDYFCHKGYNINYKELFEKLPKDD